jgi:hypothetical protein
MIPVLAKVLRIEGAYPRSAPQSHVRETRDLVMGPRKMETAGCGGSGGVSWAVTQR